jgi:type I restriction enzyme S subunit
MKESGIEGIGEIPEHWQIKKLKFVGSMKSGDFISSEDINVEGDYPVLGGNGLRGFTSAYTHEGDFVLIGRQGALCGNINYAKDKFWATEHAVVVSRLNDENVIWLGEFLRSMNLNRLSVAAAQPGLSIERIKELSCPYPDLLEQNAIGDFIKNTIETTSKTIEQSLNTITLLKEYRQSLISSAVTGKIDVSNYGIHGEEV